MTRPKNGIKRKGCPRKKWGKGNQQKREDREYQRKLNEQWNRQREAEKAKLKTEEEDLPQAWRDRHYDEVNCPHCDKLIYGVYQPGVRTCSSCNKRFMVK